MAAIDAQDYVENGSLEEEQDLNAVFLEERFDMECRQELDRVGRLSKVSNAIKNKLGHKIARNVITKKITGPLGNRYAEPPASKPHPNPLSTREELKHREIRLLNHVKKSQDRELDTLRREGIVKKKLADRRMRASARQMFNHRLYVDDTDQTNRKTSILVTGVEPEQEIKTAACLRQESILYIDSFFQTPSKSRRMLSRLNSQQLQGASESELRRKTFCGFQNETLDNFSRVRSETDPHNPTAPFQGTVSGHRNGKAAGFSSKHKSIKTKVSKLGKKLKPGAGKRKRPHRIHHGSSSFEDEILVSPKKNERKRIGSTARKLKSAVQKENLISLKSSSHKGHFNFPTVSSSHGPPPPPPESHDLTPTSYDPLPKSHDPLPLSPVLFSMDSQVELDGLSHPANKLHENGGILENGSHDDHVTSTLKEIDQEEEGYISESESGTYSDQEPSPRSKTTTNNRVCVDGDSPDYGEFEDEIADLPEQKPVNQATSTFHGKRHFSTPNIGHSPSIYPGDHIPHHGFYTPAKVEVNPFEIHFKKGYEENIAIRETEIVTQCTSTACEADEQTLTRTLTLQHSEEVTSKVTRQRSIVVEQAREGDIPSHAFEDPNFLRFVQTLGRDPKPADYITYKLRTIGDQIDSEYDDKLNQALDAIFFEAIKNQVSLESFKSISKRLILEGQRLQDGIFLVTCFGRRLAEMVPTIGDNVTAFTEIVLDTYASDILLSIGGWGRLVESYHQVETGPSCYECDYYDDEYMDYANQRSYQTTPLAPPQIITVNPPETCPDDPPNFAPHNPLRRVISVEVLFQEPDSTEHAQSPGFHRNTGRKVSLTRSLSASSLNVSSATLQNTSFSFYSQFSRRPVSEVVRVEASHFEETANYHYSRRGSTASICSNVSAIRLVGETKTQPNGPLPRKRTFEATNGKYLNLHLDTPGHTPNGSLANQIQDDDTDSGHTRSLALPLTIAAIAALGTVAVVGFLYFRNKH